MHSNNNQSDNCHVEKNSTLQMSNSLANKQIMEKSHVTFYLIFCQGVLNQYQARQKTKANFSWDHIQQTIHFCTQSLTMRIKMTLPQEK